MIGGRNEDQAVAPPVGGRQAEMAAAAEPDGEQDCIGPGGN